MRAALRLRFNCLGKSVFVCWCAGPFARAGLRAVQQMCVCFPCAARFKRATLELSRKPGIFFPPLPRPILHGGVSFPKGPVQGFSFLSHLKRAALGDIKKMQNKWQPRDLSVVYVRDGCFKIQADDQSRCCREAFCLMIITALWALKAGVKSAQRAIRHLAGGGRNAACKSQERCRTSPRGEEIFEPFLTRSPAGIPPLCPQQVWC